LPLSKKKERKKERKIERKKERKKDRKKERKKERKNKRNLSWDIFTSHAVFWRARRASQNTTDE